MAFIALEGATQLLRKQSNGEICPAVKPTNCNSSIAIYPQGCNSGSYLYGIINNNSLDLRTYSILGRFIAGSVNPENDLWLVK